MIAKLKNTNDLSSFESIIRPESLITIPKIILLISTVLLLSAGSALIYQIAKEKHAENNTTIPTTIKGKTIWDFSKDNGEDFIFLKGKKVVNDGFLKTEFEKETIFVLPNIIGQYHKITIHGRLLIERNNKSTKYGLFPVLFQDKKFIQIDKEDNPIETQKPSKESIVELNKQFYAKVFNVDIFILKTKMVIKFSHNELARIIHYKKDFKNNNQIGLSLRNLHISTIEIKPMITHDKSKAKSLISLGIP